MLLVAQDEFPQATNMDALIMKALNVNPTHQCKSCGLKGHMLEACGFTSNIHGELSLPPMIDLPGGWKVLTPRQARKLRLVTKAHVKLPDKEVGLVGSWPSAPIGGRYLARR